VSNKIKELGMEAEDEEVLLGLEESFPNDVDENDAYDLFKEVYKKYEKNSKIFIELVVFAKKYAKSFQTFTEFYSEDKLDNLSNKFGILLVKILVLFEYSISKYSSF
jgi:hypothetical protein